MTKVSWVPLPGVRELREGENKLRCNFTAKLLLYHYGNKSLASGNTTTEITVMTIMFSDSANPKYAGKNVASA